MISLVLLPKKRVDVHRPKTVIADLPSSCTKSCHFIKDGLFIRRDVAAFEAIIAKPFASNHNHLVDCHGLGPYRRLKTMQATTSVSTIQISVIRIYDRPTREDSRMNLRSILDFALADYALPLDGPHGIAHWARVLENSMKLAAITGAKTEVVSLFAILHDSKRLNESHDPEHGPRAAEFALQLQGRFYRLSDQDLQTLYIACHGHTSERTHPDVTIQTCWDSDRLDLARVGIIPDPARLCTDAARSMDVLQWANDRAIHGHVPPRVLDEWGIRLGH